jgi:pimeloyl-ACP methyl ester carboxylesterase
MHDPAALGVLVLADTADGGLPADARLGLPEPHRFDVVLPVSTGNLGTPPGVEVAADATGWTNALELSVPADLLTRADGTIDLSIITGAANADGTFTPHNIAFRHAEPIDIYTDRLQAFALHGGAPDGSHVDMFSSGPIALADLRGGRTQAASPGPGYHERQMVSAEGISREQGRDGRLQPYGLYIPSDFDPAVATPSTVWLHYRGGKAHSGATINPRLIHELAREDLWRVDGTPAEGTPLGGGQGNVVVTPHGRGASAWYVAQSHQDVFEVLGDVGELLPNLDPQRRYLAGYSMGGYGTYLFGLLYPDQFAAGFPVAGAVTQGAWTGAPPDSPLCGYREPFSGDDASACFIEANDGDANAQLTYRLLDNARHLPLHIDHGTNDELVPVTGVQSMAARLIELGYRVEMQTFAGYEHFTQAGVDEWADGAAYLQRFTTPTNPR